MKQLLPIISIFLSIQTNAQLVIQSGGTLYLKPDTHITLKDLDLTNNGSIASSTGSRLIFTGSQNNHLSGTQPISLYELEIAKSGANKLILQRSIGINTRIRFTSGLIDLNGFDATLATGAILENENESSRIVGLNGGRVITNVSLNAPSSANPGNLGAIITSSQDLGLVTIRRGQQSQQNVFGNGNSILRYFDISPTNNTALNATLRFHYFDAELNGLPENSLLLWKSANNLLWMSQGVSSRDVTANYAEKTGIADFSRWTLSSPGNPLPVFFLLFSGSCQNNEKKLSWKTAQEINSARFEIENSPDGQNWQLLGSVAAAGNSTIERAYNFATTSANEFFRLAAIDIDGKKTYSSILRVTCDMKSGLVLFPNPARDRVTLSLTSTVPSSLQIRAYDANGRLVIRQDTNIPSGLSHVGINLNNLSPGTYTMVCTWGDNSRVVKLVKQ